MEDLGLDVGTSINLELDLPPDHPRCDVSLIGYSRGNSLLVSLPERPALIGHLRPGLGCVVRYLHGTRIAGFKSELLHMASLPYRYLHLRYPDSVDRVTVRQAERVKTHLPCKVLCDDGGSVAAAIMDLSATGALVLCQRPIGELGAVVDVAVEIRFAGVQQALQLSAVVRNVGRRIGDTSGTGGYYGLEFVNIANEQQIYINGHIYETILARRGSVDRG